MRKNILLYILAFLLLLPVVLFFNSSYQQIAGYSELTNRLNKVYGSFQDLSGQVSNAAILNPALVKATAGTNSGKIFFTDSARIIQQLELLRAVVRDPVNVQIAAKLDTLIPAEIPWLLKSNVPDSILQHRSPGHVASFQLIGSLIEDGMARTAALIEYRKKQFNDEIGKMRLWMTVFIILSGLLLIYTSINFLRQRSRRKKKENELAVVFNRINDAVVSVDNHWRYTFLNDAALSTHPFSREDTIGKVIWDVHPGMKGTVFWDKYHEAMITGKVIEIDNYYAPMSTWFLVKVYPSADGLTIFYKDITATKTAAQQLSQSLKETTDYKFALDESSIVAVTDQKGIIQHANANFCKISKFSAAELIGQDHRIINSGYHSKEFIKDLWVTIANGKIWKGELKNKAKDGTAYWVDTTIVPFLDENHKPYQYMAIRSDITEKKKIEEQQSLFTSIINYSDDAIISKTTDGIITSWNHGAEKIFQYAAAEIIGSHISILIPAHLMDDEKKIMENIRKGKIIEHYETERVRKDGCIIHVSLTISPIKDQAGNIIGASKISRDITLQKESEERIIKSEKIYKTIASNIPGSVICLLDTDYRYLLIEGDMLEKLGYSKEKLLGNKAGDVLPAEIFASVKNEFKTALQGETVTRESAREGYDIISRFIPLKDERGQVYAIMTVAIDITELKNAQRNINELNRGLEEKIIKRTEELKKSNEELESFSYSVSHDLRAPLRAVNGYARILEEDYTAVFDEEGKRLLGEVQRNAQKMGVLIDDLLTFSRLGRKELNRTMINMNELAGIAIKEAGITAAQQAMIKQDLLLPVMADHTLLLQVMINLISNAVKYSSKQDHPLVEIRSAAGNNEIIYSVRDNGVGFDMQYAHKLFGVFQRLHAAEEFPGTGVGLAMVQRIIEKHKGRIWADAKIAEGATFYFSLPA